MTAAAADVLVVGASDPADSAWSPPGQTEYLSVDTLASRLDGVGHVIIVPRRSALLPTLEAVLGKALTRRSTVLFPEGVLPPGRSGEGVLGIHERDLPPWVTLLWSAGGTHDWQAPAVAARSVCPDAALRADAVWEPLLLAGSRARVPEAVSGFRLRYHTGPRAGSAIAVLGVYGVPGAADIIESLLRDRGRPFLVDARPDYALVRHGEGLRIVVSARAGFADEGAYSATAEVRDSSGRMLERCGPAVLDRQRGDGGLDVLSGILRVPARVRWPAPSLRVAVTLADADGRRVASIRSSVAVWDLGGARRAATASVTARRVVTRRGAAPAVTIDAERPWSGLAAGAGDPADLEAWRASFRALGDAGAGTVRMTSAAGTDGMGPEAAFRLDAARSLVAIDEGLTPELVITRSASRLDDLSPIQGLLLSAAEMSAVAELSRHWPPERIVPPPQLVEPNRALPVPVEAACVSGTGPTRVAGSLSPPIDETVLLALRGGAGQLVSDGAAGPDPHAFRRALCANTLLRLLQPSAPAPPVVMAADGGRGPALALGLPIDWGAVPGGSAAFVPPEARVLAIDAEATRAASFDVDALTRVELTGLTLLSLAAWPLTATQPTADAVTRAQFGEVRRVGKGLVARIDPERESLAGALEWAGVPAVAARGVPGCRFVRTGAPGGEVVAAVAVEGDGGNIELIARGFPVSATCRRGLPAIAAATERGAWLVASAGSVALSGRIVVAAPPGCWVVISSLDEAPLEASGAFLLFADCAEPSTVRLTPYPDREATGLKAWCGLPSNGQLVELTTRACEVVDGSAELTVEPGMCLAPIVIAPSARLELAIERLRRLIWG